jgi:peptidoglycan/xylan/chitin deacetylase (PgdA/CDA1 family)
MTAAITETRTVALMYHALGEEAEVSAAADPHYTVSMPAFLEQMALCARIGRAAISARAWLAGQPGVIVTFDDGHESNHRLAFPALRAAGMSADFFVNPAQVGTPGFANWSALREMAEAGMSIQSHGLDHRHYLTDLSPGQLREELREARKEIEDHVGQPVTLLAPPGGRCPARLADVAREEGYSHVLCSRPGPIRRPPGPMLNRFAVTAQHGSSALESWVRGGRGSLYAQLRYSLLYMTKRALGDRRYEQVRRQLLKVAAR